MYGIAGCDSTTDNMRPEGASYLLPRERRVHEVPEGVRQVEVPAHGVPGVAARRRELAGRVDVAQEVEQQAAAAEERAALTLYLLPYFCGVQTWNDLWLW